MSSISPITFFFILAGGILPAIFWLWFWLKEDDRPEPRGMILLAFLAGGFSIPLVFWIESSLSGIMAQHGITGGWWHVVSLAGVEEITKLAVAFAVTYHRKAFDEPLDWMIYLIAVALGFSAFENTLFTLKAITLSGASIGIITASMRFIGATLLHVLASSVLGGVVATAYCKTRKYKIEHAILGIGAAVLLHALFNFFIIAGDNALPVFALLWLGIILLLLFFERVKEVVCYPKFT